MRRCKNDLQKLVDKDKKKNSHGPPFTPKITLNSHKCVLPKIVNGYYNKGIMVL